MDSGINEVAVRAAQAGGNVLANAFGGNIRIDAKAPADFVSEADLASERAVVDVVRSAFPDHQIIAEESHRGQADAEHVWVIDPLDGTTNFVHGIPHSAVSVAYYQFGEPRVGVVYNPMRNDLFRAVKGQGAFANGRQVSVCPTESLADVLIGVGFYYDRGVMMEATLAAVGDLFRQQIHGVRRFGTAALDLCLVGCGSVGAFFEYQLSPWDFAAGRLFVEEAGGVVTTCGGGDLPLASSSVLAAAPGLYDEVLSIVSEHRPSPHAD